MLRIIYLSLFLLAFSCVHAQFGISGQYLNGQGDKWEFRPVSTTQATIDLPGEGWQAGIDYWFRLRNTRIEFLPTLAFSRQEETVGAEFATLDTRIQGYHFFFNTNIYFMDLAGDCDCPTFSKEGPTLQKGMYLQLSPGYSFFDFNMNDQLTKEVYEEKDSGFSIGLGLGFDLGLSDFFTISPQLGARYYPSLNWETLDGQTGLNFPDEVEAESAVVQYQLGIRLGFRLDE